MIRGAEYVVVGSGAGGASVAVELARRGKDVLVFERGPDLLGPGSHLFAMLAVDGHGFRTSREGMGFARALTTGGSTMVTCGTASRPPGGMLEAHGIDLASDLAAAEAELGVAPLPDSHIGEATLTLMETGKRLGMNWKKLDKFIDAELCVPGRCNCMLGCRRGAKWTSRKPIEEAKGRGARVISSARVTGIRVEGGRVAGVQVRLRARTLDIEAGTVILAAGGLGTPVLLKRAGIDRAGEGLFCDPLVFTIGVHPSLRGGFDPPMTVGTTDFWDDGFILLPVLDPWISFGLETWKAAPSRLPSWVRYPRTMGIMTKAKDETTGRVYADGTFSKDLTDRDRATLDRGVQISKDVLRAAGCPAESLWVTKVRGAHPGGTCPVGGVVDADLATGIDGLYVCDASVLPSAMAAPIVLTLVALAKRLTRERLSA